MDEPAVARREVQHWRVNRRWHPGGPEHWRVNRQWHPAPGEVAIVLFNSLQYLIFFPIVVGLYFAIPHRVRWLLLLAASFYFYMCWKAEYAILLVIPIVIDYTAAIQIDRTRSRTRRKMYLLTSLTSNLGLLFAFKYLHFFNDTVRGVLNHFNVFYDVPAFHLLLPVGISFYTFQTMSYVIDVYRGHQKAERHLGLFALYVTFFPQLVAGPIERSTRLLPQFFEKMEFDYDRVVSGLRLMVWGLFKKMVIADGVADYVNMVYSHPYDYHGGPPILATYLFAFQIYCDFSGYSDIAIGSARVMGYRLMENFHRPYFAKSIAEFWRRWHISLTTWFRDYLYGPLGGSWVPRWRWYSNVLIVFLVSGLWHGANWTFVIWGGLHGLYLLVGFWTQGFRKRVTADLGLDRVPTLRRALRVLITFHLVCFAWVFFRARTVTEAFVILGSMVSPHVWHYWAALCYGGVGLCISLLAILVLVSVQAAQTRMVVERALARRPAWVRWSVYYAGVMSILLLGKLSAQEFIYFQF